MTRSGPLYANQQLKSVSLETFFRGRAAALGRLELVQQEFDERLPNLFVPNAIPGHALSLQPFQLRSTEDGLGESLAIAVNHVGYASFDYPGFKEFSRAGLEILYRTNELIGVTDLTRVVFRYENLIAVERQSNGVLSLGEILKPVFEPGRGENPGFVALKADWSEKWNRGILEVSLGVENADGVDMLRLRIAAMVNPAGGIGNLSDFSGDAHDCARSCFESLITDEFREVLRGASEE